MALADLIRQLTGESQITEHLAQTPGLAREMRYSPSLAQNQGMQNYLGPLAAQDFAADARRTGDIGGMLAAAGSPAYVGAKAIAPGLTEQMTGQGGALMSQPSLEQVLRAYKGLANPNGQQPMQMAQNAPPRQPLQINEDLREKVEAIRKKQMEEALLRQQQQQAPELNRVLEGLKSWQGQGNMQRP